MLPKYSKTIRFGDVLLSRVGLPETHVVLGPDSCKCDETSAGYNNTCKIKIKLIKLNESNLLKQIYTDMRA